MLCRTHGLAMANATNMESSLPATLFATDATMLFDVLMLMELAIRYHGSLFNKCLKLHTSH